jgi:hypothetical protein
MKESLKVYLARLMGQKNDKKRGRRDGQHNQWAHGVEHVESEIEKARIHLLWPDVVILGRQESNMRTDAPR